jgi:hypothetical protein
VARQTPLGARPNRVPLAWPALEPGRLLKTCSDVRRRGMTVLDRTRPAAAVIPALRVYMNVVVVKKHIADNDLSATYRSLVVGIVGVIDEKSIE